LANKTKTPTGGQKSVDGWCAEYQRQIPIYEEFLKKLQDLIQELMQLSDIDYHTLESRVKDPASFREKILRPGKDYKDPLSELPDLAGLRLTVYYRDDIERIREILKSEFYVDASHSVDKTEQLGPDQFGYLSVHEVITLSDGRKALTEWSRFANLRAEVQIRTVLQHAWASISHKLAYKQEIDIPYIFRRKLVRLSGLLELADEQFSELRHDRTEFFNRVSDSVAEEKLEIALDRDSVIVYLENSDIIAVIVNEANRAGFESKADWDQGLSQFLNVARQMRLSSIEDVDKLLRERQRDYRDFFEKFRAIWGRGAKGSNPHWVAVVLVGIDHGRRLTIHSVPWENHDYTRGIFDSGKSSFGYKDEQDSSTSSE
jgi:putative GTP pyrophosphokinase